MAGPVAANDARPPAALRASPRRRQRVGGVGEAGLEVEKRVPLTGDAEAACWGRPALVEEEEEAHAWLGSS